MIAIQSRKYGKKQTTGHLCLFDEDDLVFDCKTLEPPWRGNKKNISCIPEREYDVIPHDSPKYGRCLLIKDVPNRSYILFHWLNFYTETEGCIGVGRDFKDINSDNIKDIISSKNTFDKLMKVAPDGFRLKIISENTPED